MREWIKEMVRSALSRKIERCEKTKAWCEFYVPGYCLLEFIECPYEFGVGESSILFSQMEKKRWEGRKDENVESESK